MFLIPDLEEECKGLFMSLIQEGSCAFHACDRRGKQEIVFKLDPVWECPKLLCKSGSVMSPQITSLLV